MGCCNSEGWRENSPLLQLNNGCKKNLGWAAKCIMTKLQTGQPCSKHTMILQTMMHCCRWKQLTGNKVDQMSSSFNIYSNNVTNTWRQREHEKEKHWQQHLINSCYRKTFSQIIGALVVTWAQFQEERGWWRSAEEGETGWGGAQEGTYSKQRQPRKQENQKDTIALQ